LNTTKYIWQNNKFIPWDDAKTHVLTHSLHYGSGAFEGIRAYATDKGTAIFRLPEHIKRLFYSISCIDMQLPYTEKEICEITLKLVAMNELKECYIRPLAYYGYGKMGVNPIGAPPEIAIACWAWDSYIAHPSVDLKVSEYVRIPRSVSIADAKLTGNYLNSILGLLKIKGTHYHETLFLDIDGYLAEGSADNIFVIKNNKIYTPRLGSILAGITRQTAIELAKDMGISVEEKNLKLEDIFTADEAFLTGTAIEIMPIRSIDDKLLGSGEAGKITKNIQKNYLDLVRGKHTNPKFQDYLAFV